MFSFLVTHRKKGFSFALRLFFIEYKMHGVLRVWLPYSSSFFSLLSTRKALLNVGRDTSHLLHIAHQLDLISYCSYCMKLLLWNTKGLGSKVKSPINKEEITFTCRQGPVLLQDWWSHIKWATSKGPSKTVQVPTVLQMFLFFFSIMSFLGHVQSYYKIFDIGIFLFVGLVIF